jgi:hypothetical protein
MPVALSGVMSRLELRTPCSRRDQRRQQDCHSCWTTSLSGTAARSGSTARFYRKDRSKSR